LSGGYEPAPEEPESPPCEASLPVEPDELEEPPPELELPDPLLDV
jgi:hypothetical protein